MARSVLFGLFVLPLSLLADAPGAQPSTNPPAAYAARAAGLLTPLEKLRSVAATRVQKDDAAQVLIDETIHLVEPDGRVLRVRQVAYRVLTEAGVKPLSEDLFGYSRDRQKFHLVRAAVIQPDGVEQLVAPDAIITQSPQRQADLAIYSDVTEVRVIYPHIRVGSITHAITVTEDTEARMPGTYTTRRPWGSDWPAGIERIRVELPPNLAARARWFTLGPGAPSAQSEERPDGSMAIEWRAEDSPARRREISRAPSSQTGPCLHVTTLADWDEVAGWFQGLLSGRDTLPPELVAEADRWIASAPDRESRLRLLFRHVANDVRYVSLALGEGDYRPRPCGDVWGRRHGDCKDKSNLLVALLRRAGIDAHLALLNTTHLGFVDRRAPDYRVFSHAIVALPAPGGGYTFCDPTIACGEPGLLSPSGSDRDVLILREGRAEWARTPAQSAGRLDYAFDLTLNSAGELSGWLTTSAEGFYAAWERDRFRELDTNSRRSSLSQTTRGFFPGADVIDVTVPPADESGPAVARAYFIVPAQTDSANGPAALRFPSSRSLLLNLGDTEKRETPFFLYQEQTRVTARIALPPGVVPPVNLPSPISIETPTGVFRARWISDGGALRTELEMDIRQSTLPAVEFPRFYQASLAFENWLGQPLPLPGAGSPAALVSAPAPAAVDLPLMPSGAGQLELIAKRYPSSGDRALRRAALQRTLQYFPNDVPTVFSTGIYLADLDWQADQNQAALDRLDSLLANHRGAVPPADVCWAEHLRAFVLRDLKRNDDALEILTRLARDPAAGEWRRSQCALGAVTLLENAPGTAAELLAGCVTLASEKQGAVLAALARLRLVHDQEPALRATLSTLSAAQPDALETLLVTVTDASAGWPEAPRAKWLAISRSLAPKPGEALAASFERAEAESRMLVLAGELRARLRDAFTRPELSAWLDASPTPEAPKSWADFDRTREALVEKNASEATVRLGVRALLALPPSADAINRVWRVAADADWHERRTRPASDDPVYSVLLELGESVPFTHEVRLDTYFLRGSRLARLGRHIEARDLYAGLLANPEFPASFRLSAHDRLAEAHENLGALEDAIAAARPLEDHVADSARNTDRVFRSALLHLHLGQYAEALRVLGILEKASEDTLRKADCEFFLRELLALRRAGQAEAFWKAHRSWWPIWAGMAGSLALPPPGPETTAPVVANVATAVQALRKAAADKDEAAYWRQFRALVSAARWLPSVAPEISSLQSQAAALAPAQSANFLKLVLAQVVIPGYPEDNDRLRAFHNVATLYDAGRHADALAAASAYRKVHPLTDPQTHAVNRVRALAAIASGAELAEATAALEYDLAHPVDRFPRATTVETLASVYRARQLADEESALLERELVHPRIIADEAALARLKERHETLGGSVRFASAVREWMEQNPLPWYEHAGPAGLDDPRVGDLQTALEDPEKLFSHHEAIKFRLLAAQSPDIGFARQAEALRLALGAIHESLPTHSESLRFADSVILDTRLDESLRAGFLWHLVNDAYIHRRDAEFKRWRNHSLATRYNEEQKTFVAGLHRIQSIDKQDPAALQAFATALVAKPLGDLEVAQLHEVLAHFIRLDAFEQARALVASGSSWRFAPAYKGSRQSTALQLARALRTAEAQAPVHRALVARVQERFPSPPAEPPAAYADLRVSAGTLPTLALADMREAGLWLIGSRLFTRDDFGFWSNFIQAFYFPTDTRDFALGLIETALREAPDDEIRAEILSELFDSVDHDEPAALARLRAATAPYADPVAHPLCARYLRMQRLTLALRFDEPIDFESGLRSLDGPDDGFTRARFALRRHLQRDDAAALKKLLRELDPDLLLGAGIVPLSVPAAARVGFTDEHRLARETAARQLRDNLVDTWIGANPVLIEYCLDLAEALEDPKALPEAWVESVSTRCPDPMVRGRVRLIAAWLRSDWETAAREARALIRDYPTFYHHYWHAGAALHRLGRIEEARPLLETYARYSKDELQHPQAVALLKASAESRKDQPR